MSRLRRILRVLSLLLLAAILLVAAAAGTGWWYFHPELSVTRGVVYTQRDGREVTLDVYRPAKANGIGVILMVSGGWQSHPEGMNPWFLTPILRSGQTIFAVSHVSQPEGSVMEAVEDVTRAVRFIRHHAKKYGVDPGKLGVMGVSSGGHLSLMLATGGKPGDTGATDPVNRESSAVQAAAVFCPVTDLINLGSSTENAGDNGPPKSFRKAFGPDAMNPDVWQTRGRELSPIYRVSPALPPVLIIHGDADTLVPLDQSTRFQQKAAELGHNVRVVVKPGKPHSWLGMLWDLRTMADFFDTVLGHSRAE